MAAHTEDADSVSRDVGLGGLPRLVVRNPLANARIYLHGAHVTHFEPTGVRPVLFVSRKSMFDRAKPIRGGIPICWPWFGPHATDKSLPSHGTARISEWSVESTATAADGRTVVVLALETGEARLRYEIVVGRSLTVRLTTHNTSAAPLTITEALHTYLAVGDVSQITVQGLGGLEYVDRVTPGRGRQDEPVIRFDGEFDRTFFNTSSPVTVTDPVFNRRLLVTKNGSNSTVVWNPGRAKIKSFVDLADDEWTSYVCVETANAGENAVTLAPGASHTLESTVEVL